MSPEVGQARQLRWLCLAFATGVCLLQSQSALPAWRWLVLLLTSPVLLVLLPRHSHWRRLAWLVLALGVGFAYAQWRAQERLAEALPATWEGRAVRLVGRVAGLPEATVRGRRFVFAVERVETADALLPRRLLLNLYGTPAMPAMASPAGGDCLALVARLYRPHGSHNPGGFDYEAWLLERGIRAQGRVLPGTLAPAQCRDSIQSHVEALREALRQRIQDHLAGAPYAGIVSALALGDQDAITSAQWQLFRRTGVTHLMSISGLHVTLLGWLVYTLLYQCWRRIPTLALRWPARRVAAWGGLAVTAVYVVLAGFGIPAQRTLYMLAAVTVALSLDRLHSASRVLAAALLLVLLIDPWAVLAVGFWLSFGAVAALLYAGSGRLGRPTDWLAWGQAQWVASLALLPMLLFAFHEFSLVSPLANAFAIPTVSLLAVPLSLLAGVSPWPWPAEIAHAIIGLLMACLTWLDGLPQPVWHGAAPDIWALLLAGLGVLVLLLPRGVPGRWVGGLLFLPLIWPRLEHPAPGEFRLDVLDVGQGLSVLVRTHEHALLYDTGPDYAVGDDAGARIVAPFLHAVGIARLDGMLVSHDDSDHSGGALSLSASHDPGWLLSSLVDPGDARLSAHGRAIVAAARRPVLCVAGQSWTWDGVRFEILYPPLRYHLNPGFQDNDRSCVLRVAGAYGAVLLTGDLARLGEMTLLQSARAALASDVLVVGHHGSGGSSSSDFVEAVGAKLALISVGRANAYGHPDPAVLQRLAAAGATTWRTDRHGALALRFQPGRLESVATLNAHHRYWHEFAPEPRQPGFDAPVKRQLNPQ